MKTRKVIIHLEHDSSAKYQAFLCLEHYLQASDSDMVDVDYGVEHLESVPCTICSGVRPG